MSYKVAPIHRLAIGFAAIAATAAVLGAAVVAPAGLDTVGAQPLATTSGPRVRLSDVVIVPAGVNTAAGHEARVVSAQGGDLPSRAKQQI